MLQSIAGRRFLAAVALGILGVRALGELFQERVRFSHNIQRRLGGLQISFSIRQLALQPGNLSLFFRRLANSLTRLFPIKQTRITLFTPLSDLGGIQPIGPPILATLMSLDVLIVLL